MFITLSLLLTKVKEGVNGGMAAGNR